MPVFPNLLEWFALRANRIPAPYFDLLAAAALAAAEAGLRLQVFEVIRAKWSTADEVAAKIAAEPRGTRLLLDMLVVGGYVDRRGDRYTASASTRKWLVRGSSSSVIDTMLHTTGMIFELFPTIEAAVRSGKPKVHLHDWLDAGPDRWTVFESAMSTMAQYGAEEIARKVATPRAGGRFLDLGGGHGEFAITLCRTHDDLMGTVFDVPAAAAVARKHIQASGMSHRLAVREGDFNVDDIGSGYDVVLMIRMLHYMDPEDVGRLFKRVHSALRSGGIAVVVDRLSDRDIPGALFDALSRMFSLAYYTTLGGQLHSASDIGRRLRAAGFAEWREEALGRTPWATMLTARA